MDGVEVVVNIHYVFCVCYSIFIITTGSLSVVELDDTAKLLATGAMVLLW